MQATTQQHVFSARFAGKCCGDGGAGVMTLMGALSGDRRLLSVAVPAAARPSPTDSRQRRAMLGRPLGKAEELALCARGPRVSTPSCVR